MVQDIKEAMRQKSEEQEGVVRMSYEHEPAPGYFGLVCKLCGAAFFPKYNGVCPAKILEYKP